MSLDFHQGKSSPPRTHDQQPEHPVPRNKDQSKNHGQEQGHDKNKGRTLHNQRS